MAETSGLIIKVCGVTEVASARACLAAGVDLLGLDFVAGSPWEIDLERAHEIRAVVRGRVKLVGVFADEPIEVLSDMLDDLELDWIELAGEEPPDTLQVLAPSAYKVIRVAGPRDVDAAARYAGDLLLAEVAAPAQHLWASVSLLTGRRDVLLSGGLTESNLLEAIRVARPHGVNVRGEVDVPGKPGVKDPRKLTGFVRAVRRAQWELA